ncbi:MAG: 30S ribosome-binding factor RbfA [Planctomycetota bacterium]
MNERRQRRVESLLKERIAEIVDQDLADPKRGMITITRVKVDKDLQVCLVFWSALGGPNAQTQSAQVLARAAGFVQREVAPMLRTRTMPRIKFVHDDGIEGAMRIDSILQELREERPAPQAPPEVAPESPDQPRQP